MLGTVHRAIMTAQLVMEFTHRLTAAEKYSKRRLEFLGEKWTPANDHEANILMFGIELGRVNELEGVLGYLTYGNKKNREV